MTITVLVIDLFIAGINYNSTFDSRYIFPETGSLTFLSNLDKNEKEPHRILDVHSAAILHGMSPEIYHLQTLSGYTSWLLRRYSEYAYLTQSRTSSLKSVYFTDCCHHLIDALNVKYVFIPKGTRLSDLSPRVDFAAQLNEAKVEKIMQELQAGKRFKALVAVAHPFRNRKAIADGHHRYEALKRLGVTKTRVALSDDYLYYPGVRFGWNQVNKRFQDKVRPKLKRVEMKMKRKKDEDWKV